jgi:radical SAM protein with 4Fe4S-binding SPASM domain
MAAGSESLGWGATIRFLQGDGQTAIVNLERGSFLKIRSDAFPVLEEALAHGYDTVAKRLDDSGRAGLLELLRQLREKKYLIEGDDACTPGVPAISLAHYLNTPKIVYYAVSDFCNLTCSFCYAGAKKKTAPYRGDTALSLKIIDRLASLNVVNLIMSGGEPLLREDLFELVEFAKTRNLLVGITTNGTLIDAQQAFRIKASGVDYIQISIESHVEEEHDALRGAGTFRKCLEAVRWLREEGYRPDQIYTTATTTRRNIAALGGYSAFAERLGATPGTSFFQPVGRGHCNKNTLACSPREMLDFLLGKMKDKREVVEGLSPGPSSGQLSEALVPRIINCCGMGQKTLGVREDGTMVPCHLFFSSAEYEIGNILEDDITDKLCFFAHHLPTVDQIEECKDCHVRYFCGNGCWAHAFWANGTILSRNPYCEFYRTYFSAVLWNLGMKDAMTRIYEALEAKISLGSWPSAMAAEILQEPLEFLRGREGGDVGSNQ